MSNRPHWKIAYPQISVTQKTIPQHVSCLLKILENGFDISHNGLVNYQNTLELLNQFVTLVVVNEHGIYEEVDIDYCIRNFKYIIEDEKRKEAERNRYRYLAQL